MANAVLFFISFMLGAFAIFLIVALVLLFYMVFNAMFSDLLFKDDEKEIIEKYREMERLTAEYEEKQKQNNKE